MSILKMFRMPQKEKFEQPEKNAEKNIITKEQVDRIFSHDVKIGEIIKKLEQNKDIADDEKELVGKVAMRGAEGAVFGIKPGDQIVTFLAPGGNLFSIKNLNDNIFNQAKTTEIIIKRREILEAELNEMGEQMGVKFTSLEQSYKSDIFKIENLAAEGQVVDVDDLNKIFTLACENLNKKIIRIIERMLVEERKDNPNKEGLNNFENQIKKHKADIGSAGGFRMTYGIDRVRKGVASDFKLRIEAMDRSRQKAQISRSKKEYGGAFSEEEVLAEIINFSNLRQKLENKSLKYNEVDQEIKIFDGEGKIDKNILRDIRKGTIASKTNDNEANKVILEQIVSYIQAVNIFDAVRPWTREELGDQEVAEGAVTLPIKLAEKRGALEILKKKELTVADRREIINIIKYESKDANCTSRERFHEQAINIERCVYMGFDVLDVGIDLTREYEDLMLDILKIDNLVERITKFQEFSLSAGDKVTNRLRDFRKKVIDVCGKYYEGEVLTKVDGDEFFFALDADKIKSEDVNKLLVEIKQKTSGKMRISVARVDRSTELEASDKSDAEKKKIKIEKHLESLDLLDRELGQAKIIEEAFRELGLIKIRDPKKDLAISKEFKKRFNFNFEDLKNFVISAGDNKSGGANKHESLFYQTADDGINEIELAGLIKFFEEQGIIKAK